VCYRQLSRASLDQPASGQTNRALQFVRIIHKDDAKKEEESISSAINFFKGRSTTSAPVSVGDGIVGLRMSPSGTKCATANQKGVVTVLSFAGSDAKFGASKVELMHVAHDGEIITAMEWSTDERHLFCGDAKGNLTVSTIKASALKQTAATPQTLTQEGSAWAVKMGGPVVQISTATNNMGGAMVLVSTQIFSFLLCLKTRTIHQVGSKPRNGMFGACFHTHGGAAVPSGSTQSPAATWLLASRPGRRLWLVSSTPEGTSTVAATLRLSSLPPPSALPWGNGESVGDPNLLQFGRLFPIGPTVLSVSRGGLALLDFVSVTCPTWWQIKHAVPEGLIAGNFSLSVFAASAFVLAGDGNGSAMVWQMSAPPTTAALVQAVVMQASNNSATSLVASMRLASRLQVEDSTLMEAATSQRIIADAKTAGNEAVLEEAVTEYQACLEQLRAAKENAMSQSRENSPADERVRSQPLEAQGEKVSGASKLNGHVGRPGQEDPVQVDVLLSTQTQLLIPCANKQGEMEASFNGDPPTLQVAQEATLEPPGKPHRPEATATRSQPLPKASHPNSQQRPAAVLGGGVDSETKPALDKPPPEGLVLHWRGFYPPCKVVGGCWLEEEGEEGYLAKGESRSAQAAGQLTRERIASEVKGLPVFGTPPELVQRVAPRRRATTSVVVTQAKGDAETETAITEQVEDGPTTGNKLLVDGAAPGEGARVEGGAPMCGPSREDVGSTVGDREGQMETGRESVGSGGCEEPTAAKESTREMGPKGGRGRGDGGGDGEITMDSLLASDDSGELGGGYLERYQRLQRAAAAERQRAQGEHTKRTKEIVPPASVVEKAKMLASGPMLKLSTSSGVLVTAEESKPAAQEEGGENKMAHPLEPEVTSHTEREAKVEPPRPSHQERCAEVENSIAALLSPQVLSMGGDIGQGLDEVLLAGAAEVGAEDTNELLLKVVLALLDQRVLADDAVRALAEACAQAGTVLVQLKAKELKRHAAVATFLEPLDAHLWCPPPPQISRVPTLRRTIEAEASGAPVPAGPIPGDPSGGELECQLAYEVIRERGHWGVEIDLSAPLCTRCQVLLTREAADGHGRGFNQMLVFPCGHVFHRGCSNEEACGQCTQLKDNKEMYT